MEADFKMLCKDCKSVEWCKHAFGRYWQDKSSGGVGCRCPLPQDPTPFIRAVKKADPPQAPVRPVVQGLSGYLEALKRHGQAGKAMNSIRNAGRQPAQKAQARQVQGKGAKAPAPLKFAVDAPRVPQRRTQATLFFMREEAEVQDTAHSTRGG